MYLFAVALGALFLFSTESHAYLDGGTSSMLLQLIFGGIAGAMVFFKLFWYKIVSFFKSKD